MDLRHFKVLRAIADTGSFVEAAKQLGLTQSALSHQIRHLEEELEETLVVRTRPKVYPTAAGRAVLDAGRVILSEMDALEARFLKAKTGPVSGLLRVAATNMAIVHMLSDLCETFVARYPGIELAIRSTETPVDAVRRVALGTADIAFTPFFTTTGDRQPLTRVVLGSTEHAFIVARHHPLADRAAVELDELRSFPFVLFQEGSGTRTLTDDLFLSTGGYPPIMTESNDAQFVKRIVGLGSSVALVPAYALAEEARAGRLKLLPYAGGPLSVEFGLIHKDSVRMNAIELFKSVCLDARGPGQVRYTIEDARRHLAAS